MPRKWLKTQLFDKYKVHEHPRLSALGKLLTKENLWHINRHSISTGTAVGLFCAFIPVPFQMVIAALVSVVVRGNIPTAVALVWITNPLTIGPIFYTCYKIGQAVLEPAATAFQEVSPGLFPVELTEVWNPLLLGSLIVGSIAAILGYTTVKLLWRLHIASYLKRRRNR